MNESQKERAIRRILVALDASTHSLTALQAAAELAADLKAELEGLYIEDADLLQAADLPFSYEVRERSLSTEVLSHVIVQRQFRAQAARARKALESVAARSNLHCTFRIVRGQVAHELMVAAGQADLLLLGKAGSGYSSRRKLGRTARAVLSAVNRPTLIVQREARLEPGVLLVYDDSSRAAAALDLAVQLTLRRANGRLTILLLSRSEDSQQALRATIAARYGAIVARSHIVSRDSADADDIVRLVRESQAGIVVVPATDSMLAGQPLQALLQEIDKPVLFVG